ncbi:SGNH/GDSL hydrolase family protein [Desulfosporosinus sp. FKA]|uniref:SGNH/GDSL hydrolase family protein n=1 Tax=Desulfosporosinus sp. FKA TaxID=1969834 RepID=UPI000B49DFB0|nr:SGNH/GDSL hydrolase family protein [Desulfosporosinus sp. FKA]
MKRISVSILVLLIFVLAGLGLSIRQPLRASQKSETAPTAVTVTKHQPLKGISKLKNGTINAVILGDSISVSQGASDPSVTGWNSDLNKSLFDTFGHKIVWDNKGSSGKLIDYALNKAKEISSSTDAVFICLGRIDRNFSTPEQFSEKYTELITIIKSRAPNADIFCIVEPPMISLDESKFAGIRSTIIDVSAKTGSNLLDVWSAFPKDHHSLSELLEDVLHPNDKGNKLMSNFIYQRLVTVINNEVNSATIVHLPTT